MNLDLNWKKNWVGGWTLLECSYFGKEYTKGLREYWGVGLNCVLFHFEKDKSENYIDAKFSRTFSEQVAEFASASEANVEEMLQKVKKTAKNVLDFIHKQQGMITVDDYHELWRLLDKYLPTNFPIKKVAECLPETTLKKVLPMLEEARTATEPVYTESMAFVKRFAEQQCEKIDLRPHQFLCITRTELKEFFNSGNLPSKELLDDRYTFSIMLVAGDDIVVITGQEAKDQLQKITSAIGTSLEGQSAYPGIVEGKVKIVTDPKKIKELPENTILVTGMTRPEYLHLFKKAAAVVTDAGGILCHAAITAREMKKPTIVGTETATKVFKDGDLVEVDADKGVVRKLR